MGEIKSVKVDNWGVFFLQKLQNFFNKTDYCDLTLQFNDNSQLKVHRLVLSACTDYFNVLEQTCEVVDDALIMPNELQADVVVPIVNFMYTGTLEFELKMYGKLLRTAKEMKMTVLLKLLEAHRRTMEGVNRTQKEPSSPKMVRKRVVMSGSVAPPPLTGQIRTFPQQQLKTSPQGHRVLTTANAPIQRRILQTKVSSQQQQVQQQRQQIGATSLLKIPMTAGYEALTQFKQERDEGHEQTLPAAVQQQTPASPFEQLRKGYNNNKRPASSTFIPPPAKKPNIEDVKEFAEQQRMRKQIAAEYGEQDQEYEGMLDDDIHNDDDDDDAALASSSAANTNAYRQQPHPQQRHQQQQSEPSITIKQEPNEKPTIVVKDSANSKMNHAKIISEVIRQYPHLVKSNKNIKLKILPNVGGQSQKIIVKKEQIDNISAELRAQDASSQPQQQQVAKQPQAAPQTLLKTVEKTPQSQMAAPPPPRTNMPTAAQKPTTASTSSSATAATTAPEQKRRIDSKTMHALIAQGAENTTGPWLCLRCGVNGRPISIPSYRGFRRHLINTHKEAIDAALCEHCGWRSANNRELHFHMQVQHEVRTTIYTFPACLMCAEAFLDTNALNQHMIDSHPDENQQQCIYCNKIFAKELQLYTHMKTYHKAQAIDDGIIDGSDDEHMETALEDEQNLSPSKNKKIKILSDISLPLSTGALMGSLEPSSETGALSTIASGIVASIGLESTEETEEFMQETVQETAVETTNEPKFVTADGNEMLLTDEQRKEIMSQLNQEHDGGVVMVLNDAAFPDAAVAASNEEIEEEEAASLDEAVAQQSVAGDGLRAGEEDEELEDREHADMAEDRPNDDDDEGEIEEHEFDDNNIYNEFQANTSAKKDALDESKGSIENLEWAENLISAHDLEDASTKCDEQGGDESDMKEDACAKEDAAAKDQAAKDQDISKKLKELTGDWSDDETDVGEGDETATEENNSVQDLLTAAVEDKSHESYVGADTIEGSEHIVEQSAHEQEEEEPTDQPAMIAEQQISGEKVEQNEDETADQSEDDIDMALKSLHKEVDKTEDSMHQKTHSADAANDSKKSHTKEGSNVVHDAVAATLATDEHDMLENENDEKLENMDVDENDAVSEAVAEKTSIDVAASDSTTKASAADEDAHDADVKKTIHEPNEEEEKIKNVEDAQTDVASAMDVELKSSVLDELIQSKEEEASGEEPETNTDVEMNEAMPKAAAIEIAEPISTDATKAPEKMCIKGKNANEKEDSVTAAAAVSPTKEAVSTESASSATPEETVATTTADDTIAATTTRSVDTVRTLINEWGDDEEDADEQEL